MKFIVVCLLMVLSVGCINQKYTSTQVGPDRFAVASIGSEEGPENYSHILEHAYRICAQFDYKDYIVTNVAFEHRRVVAFIQCHNNKPTVTPVHDVVVAPVTPPKEEIAEQAASSNATSWQEDLDKLYQAGKKKISELGKD